MQPNSNTYDVDAEYPAATGPDAVVALMAGVLDAALAARLTVVHPGEVTVEPGGRLTLVLSPPRPERSGATPPETEGARTLAYSVGAIGALAALGTMPPAPADAESHRRWHQALREQLRATWSGRFEAEPVADWIARCTSFDPMERPGPDEMGAELRSLARRREGRIDALPMQLHHAALPVLAAATPAIWATGRGPAPSQGWPRWVPLALGGLTLALGIASCALGGLTGGIISDAFPRRADVQVTPPPAQAPAPPPAAAEAVAIPAVPAAVSAVPEVSTATARPPVGVVEAGPSKVRFEAPAAPQRPARPRPSGTPSDKAAPSPAPASESTDRAQGSRRAPAPGSDLRDPWQQPMLQEAP